MKYALLLIALVDNFLHDGPVFESRFSLPEKIFFAILFVFPMESSKYFSTTESEGPP